MIVFEKLRFKNFLSTGNTFTEIELNKHRSTLIVGENGSGKSTMLDALCFVLYGSAFRKINKPNLVNSVNEKGALVEVEFTTNGRKYKIIRGIKPNIFEIYKDDNLIDQTSSMKDYQNILEQNILRMNYKSFIQIVVLGSRSFVPFMRLAAGDRRNVIEDLLDIQIFSVMNAVCKQKISANKTDMEAIDNKMKYAEENVKLLKETIEELEHSNESRIKELLGKIEELEKERDDFGNQITEHETKLEDLTNDLIDVTVLEDEQRKLIKLQSKAESYRNNEQKLVKFFEDHTECPTCNQEISEEYAREYSDAAIAKIETYTKGIDKVTKQISEKNAEIKQVAEISKKISKVESDLQTSRYAFKNKLNEIITLNDTIEDLRNTQNNLLISSNKNKLEEANKLIDDYSLNRRELKNDREYLDAALLLLKDGGIKTRVIKQYLPIMNKHINKYLESMDFFANFNINEEFEETIKSRHRDSFSYENFSEGEKMRIDLSLLFTWRIIAAMKNSVSTNLLILDEILDSSLDGKGTDEFLKILQVLGDSNTFVISHKGDQVYDKFDEVLRFKKVKGFSQSEAI